MAFDPTKPADSTRVKADELRNQFNGLKALIDAIPAGPPGPEGPQGPAFSSVQIGSVMTGTPGSPAGAQVVVSGNNVELLFTIPAGETVARRGIERDADGRDLRHGAKPDLGSAAEHRHHRPDAHSDHG